MPPVRAAVLALMTAVPAALHARPAPTAPPGWASFAAHFDRVAAEGRLVGGAALLLRDGQVVARHHVGLADEARGQRVDDRTIFHWASITKTLTALAAMQLVHRGRLDLAARVTDFLPELRQVHAGAGGSVDSIRVWMLLAHASGLQNPTWPYGSGAAWEPFEPTRYAQLVAMLPYQRLHFIPGTRFGYSNPAYVYLARLIEAVTGDPWGVYVQKNLWTPLGMGRSYVGATPYHLEADRSNGYAWVARQGAVVRHVYGRDFDPGVTIPNGGWNAPLDDLAAYARFLLGTPLDGPEAARYEAVLPRAVLAQMWEPRVPTAGGDGEVLPGESMGLGFFVCPRGADTFVGHTGEQAGHRAFLYLNPATRAAVVGVFNTTDYAHGDAPEARFRALVEDALALLR